MEEKANGKVIHIISLVLGIISIIFSTFWYISIPSGIIALIFGVKSAKKFNSKIGKAGLITGIIGLSICAFLYITFIILLIVNNF